MVACRSAAEIHLMDQHTLSIVDAGRVTHDPPPLLAEVADDIASKDGVRLRTAQSREGAAD